MRVASRKKFLLPCIVTPLVAVLCCEYLIYWVVQSRCQWFDEVGGSPVLLRAIMVADPHLLGPIKGHWFDKVRTERQMHRAYATADAVHQPDAAFFLGDLFDEGSHVDGDEFEDSVRRFRDLFPGREVHVVVGNHDVGFHYEMTRSNLQRFYRSFNTSSVQLLRLRGVPFVTVNSMALENDGCSLCLDAEKKIKLVSQSLRPDETPYLLQHFPLYRASDETCQGEDAATGAEKVEPFEPKWDCLSQQASDWLLKQLRPSAVFSGHTHNGCEYRHGSALEYSVPSLSWRNRDNPGYLLVTFTADGYGVTKCTLPRYSIVVSVYAAAFVAAFSVAVWLLSCRGN